MHLVRGRARTLEADRAVGERLLETAADGTAAVRVWIPHRQVAFGRRDARLEGYRRAQAAARGRGFPPVERAVGGRAVAFDGTTTVAFALAEPTAGNRGRSTPGRGGIPERYDRIVDAVEAALVRLGVGVERGEPADAFCPGSHSLSIPASREGAGKVVGVAQRVTRERTLLSGLVVIERGELPAVLAAVYDALAVPFAPSSVGRLAEASDDATPARVRDALEDALVGDRDVTTVVDAADSS